jgi:hypothetical protein
METGLVDEPVLLLGVAAAARRDDVVPSMRPAARLGDHVIQVLRRRATVLTRPVIAREHGSTSERRLSAIGNANEPAKTEHRGRVHRDVLRAEDLSVGRKDFGLLLQDEHHGASRSDYRERLVRRVQDQCSSHAGQASIRSHLQELGMERPPTARPGTFRCLIRPNRSVVIPHRGGGAFARRDTWSSEQGAARGVHRPGAGAAVSVIVGTADHPFIVRAAPPAGRSRCATRQ